MEGRLCRWALALQEFDFEIRYRSGVENTNADVLSRKPVEGDISCPILQFTNDLDLKNIRASQKHDPLLSRIIRDISLIRRIVKYLSIFRDVFRKSGNN